MRKLRTEAEIISNWHGDIEKPVVSICCITYNHELYIEDALEGFLIQETDFPFEILIHDDASTDSTAEIIKEYEERYPKLIKPIYQKENQYSKIPTIGPRFLWPIAKGTYIALCEGDDYWTNPLKLTKQVQFLTKNIEYSGCSHQSKFLENGNKTRYFKEGVQAKISINDLIRGRQFHTASVVFRATVAQTFSKFPPVLSGDRLLNFCILSQGEIRYFDDCMCIYRKHSSGASINTTIQRMRLDLDSINYLENIITSFPKYRYSAYVHATIGLSKNGSFFEKTHHLFLAFIYSFAYFPKNILMALTYLKKSFNKTK